MKMMSAAALTAALFASTLANAAHAEERIADPFDRADASFSRHPLNLPNTPQAIGRLTNGDSCDDDGLACEWEDAAGVAHVFAGNILAIKVVDTKALGDRDIPALGIGPARTRSAVLARVRAFLPEIPVDCLEPGKAGQGNGIASCEGSFANGGWFKLLFGPDSRLISARIDAFQID